MIYIRQVSNTELPSRLTPDRRREQIVAIAATHFARDGVASASMSAIARDAGVTRALVYHYFPGKDALHEAVMQREADALLAATEPAPGEAPRASVERALDAYFSHFAASEGGVRDLYASGAGALPAARRFADANHEVQLERIIRATGVADTHAHRLALIGWLAFVESTAANLEAHPDLTRRDALALCVRVLEGALGVSIEPAAGDR